jgi:hypothetical protein
MNIQLVKSYIEEYKKEFDRVHNQEIYKWYAIKQFQENFDINSKDFYSNIEISLAKSDNLLVSHNYFPKGMLLENVKKSPEQVREMFKILFDEDFDFLERIENFRAEFSPLSKVNFPNKKNHYQDHRAVVVYLTLMYPERYFFYKFGMFKNFTEKVDYPYKPVKGRIENIGQFHSLCELVRYEIEKDQELLKLHESRLGNESYRDKSHNVLTQDFIYAVVQHLDELEIQNVSKPEIVKEKEIPATELNIKSENKPNFTPIITNHTQNNIENKRIGDLGEIWVLKQEKEFLEKNGEIKLAEKILHSAKNKGDGLGYDILSYHLNGEKKYIEVKTTKGKKNTPFFISRNELERSKIEKNNYFLYRVYEYNEETEKGNILKIKGDLTKICEIPVNYKVNLK